MDRARERRKLSITGGLLGVAVMMLAACGSTSSPASTTAASTTGGPSSTSADLPVVNAVQHPETASLCGDKPLTIAYLAAYASPWQQLSYAEMQKEAKSCPNVTTKYLSADGDPQKSIANIQSAAAQGYSGLVIYAAGGEAELPAMRQALGGGVSVVPFDSSVGGTAGQDYTDFIGLDLASVGSQEAAALGKAIDGKGTVVFLGGPAGNSFTQGIFDAFKSTMTEQYPNVTIVTGAPVATDYSASTDQKVMAGLFAKYPQIDGLAADYGAAAVGALRAFTAAGKPFPSFATNATSNELGCLWKASAPSSAQLFALDGTTLLAPIAFRKALAGASGINDPEASTVTLFPFEDTMNGKPAQCDTSLPPAADLSGSLTAAEAATVLK